METFDQEVRLHAPEPAVHVGREADAVRTLLLEVVGEQDAHPVAAHDGDVEVLVEGLRGAESSGVAQPQADLLGGVEAQVGARAGYRSVDQVVLVQPAADQQRPLLVFPLVLRIGADDVYGLVGGYAVTGRFVLQVVEAVLRAERQLRGEEEQAAELVDVLRSGREGQVVRVSVGVEVPVAAVVAPACRVLERGIEVQPVAMVVRRVVERASRRRCRGRSVRRRALRAAGGPADRLRAGIRRCGGTGA